MTTEPKSRRPGTSRRQKREATGGNDNGAEIEAIRDQQEAQAGGNGRQRERSRNRGDQGPIIKTRLGPQEQALFGEKSRAFQNDQKKRSMSLVGCLDN